MISSSVARLTRQLTQLSVAGSGGCVVTRLTSISCRAVGSSQFTASSPASLLSARTFATDRKSTKKTSSEKKETKADDPQPFLQHQEWVKFQQSIKVDGFQTGQVTTAEILKKSKGGKQARNRKARELALQQQMDPTFGGNASSSSNKFPAIRYSPEETEELLKLAFNTIPKREGKRGTRNLKRQDRRWKLVRQIRAKYKSQVEAAHHRRMEHRHWKREQTKAVKSVAPEICAKDAQYQASILRRWAANMIPAETGTTLEGDEASNHAKAGKMASAKE